MNCQSGSVQDQTAAEAEEKTRLMSQLDEANQRNQKLSADSEAHHVEMDSLAAELQRLKLSLEVSSDILCLILISPFIYR